MKKITHNSMESLVNAKCEAIKNHKYCSKIFESNKSFSFRILNAGITQELHVFKKIK